MTPHTKADVHIYKWREKRKTMKERISSEMISSEQKDPGK
jgi:hypothetical protein